MKGNKTEMELVATETTLAPSEQEQEWLNAKSINEQRNAKRRAIRSALNVVVKHNTPIEQVCMSARLLTLIDDVFSATGAEKIMARLGDCEGAEITRQDIALGVFALYKNAKRAHDAGELTLASVCELTEKGVKMDRYAFSFKIPKN